MDHSNKTLSEPFFLLGLSGDPHLQILCFLVLLLMYLITLFGNLLLIVVVRINPKLQTPMYFFLTNLSVIDLCFSSTVVPIVLRNTLSKDKSISLSGCAAQMFFALVLGATECLLLAVMAFDRYVAICKPLHYYSIMNTKVCACLALVVWTAGVINSTIHVFITFQLPFCRTHHVDNFFCEVPPFLRMACKDTRLNEVAVYISAGVITLCACMLTLVSYIHIISAILNIHSSEGRHKAFSTCVSHLTVVSLYYGTILFIYLQPRSPYAGDTNKAVSILYTAVTPMLNPIIYSMRNKDVKGSLKINPKWRSNLTRKALM